MEEQRRLICNRTETIMNELNSYIDYLYISPCLYSRYIALVQLKCKIQELQFISRVMCAQNDQALLNSLQKLPAQRAFTLEELEKYNGKNGNPAYVAVNGTVYDVTNNAAWAAASHFGLSAGKDLTGEFASCHAGQPILNKLRVVGKLV